MGSGRTIKTGLEEARPGRFLNKDEVLQTYKGFDIYLLCNDTEGAVLEISPMEMEGLFTMTVVLVKKRAIAGVIEINGAAGRYPFYLPYPEGKEMTPNEREAYSLMLFYRLQK